MYPRKSWPNFRDWVLAIGVFAAIIALYACSLDSDIGFWDTGEMNTVPYILGLAHPTGFPAEILFGWLFSHSFPFGTIAFRLTLLNAIEASVTGLLIYTFVRLEGGPRWLAAVSGLGFATTLTVWQHATHNDVMNAAVTFSAATFFLIQKWSRSANRRFLIAAG
jgi:hypothetical protein